MSVLPILRAALLRLHRQPAAGAAFGRCRLRARLVLAALLAVPGALAAPLSLETFTLTNGLRVVLNPDPNSEVASTCLSYRAGSAIEALGSTGLAYLLQRMMFEGSRNVDRGEYISQVRAVGGTAGGATTKDTTRFCTSVPVRALELVLWLEADRMRFPALNRDAFERQRAEVLEEEQALPRQPGFAQWEFDRLNELAYQGLFAYQHPPRGEVRDLLSADYAQLRRLHATYYTPTNAVLAVSGGIDLLQTREWVERLFSDIPAKPEPSQELFDTIPRHTSERLSVVEAPEATTPTVLYGWLIPPAPSSTHRALELAAVILTGGASSTLYRTQVYDKASAHDVQAATSGMRGVDLLSIRTSVAALSSVDNNQRWLDEALTRLRTHAPTQQELDRAKNLLRTRRLLASERTAWRARRLAELELLWNSAALINSELDAYGAISGEDVRNAVASYLLPHQRTVVEAYPPGWTRDAVPEVMTQTHTVKAGENLSVIARRYGTTADAIAKANRLSAKRTIFPGQKLFVTLGPKSRRVTTITHTVKKGDTLSAIAKRYGVTVHKLTVENKISKKRMIRPGQVLSITREPAAKSAGPGTPSKNGTKSPRPKGKGGPARK